MKNHDQRETIHEAALDAIDEDGLERVLRLATGEERCDEGAVTALRTVTADTLVADALAAAAAAGWRGRFPTGDDVGDAAERRRSCCEDRDVGVPTVPTSLKFEW